MEKDTQAIMNRIDQSVKRQNRFGLTDKIVLIGLTVGFALAVAYITVGISSV